MTGPPRTRKVGHGAPDAPVSSPADNGSPIAESQYRLTDCEVSGEILDAPALRRELDLPPDADASQLLLAAWRHRPAECLQRMDGALAFALRTGGTDAWLGRDPCGLRNLYWYRRADGSVAFDFDLHRLSRQPGVPKRLARRSLHEYLRFGDIAAPHTLFEGIHAVEPGQLLHVTPTGVETQTWPVHAGGMQVPSDLPSAVDRLDTLLGASVRRQLAGAGHPAAFLSGGVDSSLICALAARERGDLVAVTVGFDGADDEAPAAQRIAKHLGLRHETLRFGHEALVEAFERLAQVMDQPTADPATPATVLAFDHCRARYDAVLDGTGADEAVGALPPRHVRVAVQYSSLLPSPARHALAALLRKVPALAPYTPLVDFEHPADTMIRWRGFSRPEIENLCGEPVSFEHTWFYRTFARFPRGAHFERYSALIDAMPCDRLTQAMRASEAPVRYPFCDREADHFIRRLPADLRHRHGEPKRILRALLARYVPRELWDGPKRGFTFPLHDFLAAGDYALVRRYLDRERWQRRAMLAPDGVRDYAQRFIGGDRQLTFRVWAMVVLGAWLEAHDEPN